ncbi:uncharacterized protein LOC104584056 isoform X2 [Brachypodium distachyon]|uniref:uncharacterized protein LOC104584056 isoform X2 n=1 Tax=Brachypodium distachyon TaxID=15368 RepID=UPI00071E5AB8|nr:uncharacterized protein LOC104584056 isoform X2 [Brachypodium distachyon]|eukprot:XP_014755872.1 uncharacterized protein LOC104584056 isoform X2 [Brachypodium distachyon]
MTPSPPSSPALASPERRAAVARHGALAALVLRYQPSCRPARHDVEDRRSLLRHCHLRRNIEAPPSPGLQRHRRFLLFFGHRCCWGPEAVAFRQAREPRQDVQGDSPQRNSGSSCSNSKKDSVSQEPVAASKGGSAGGKIVCLAYSLVLGVECHTLCAQAHGKNMAW